MRFEKHVFICINQRAPGERKSCGEAHGLELVKLFKKQIKDRGLKATIRAQKTGCLDACEFGPSVVVYPEGIFYGGVELTDVEEIVEEHLVNNRPVQRLVIDFSKKES
jgi:(2Fe-2S) ferredoxin